MGTPTPYPQRVAKPSFAPDDVQAELLAALKRAFIEKGAAESKYKKLLAHCAEADIPVAKLASELQVQRKTIYRHLGRSMT